MNNLMISLIAMASVAESRRRWWHGDADSSVLPDCPVDQGSLAYEECWDEWMWKCVRPCYQKDIVCLNECYNVIQENMRDDIPELPLGEDPRYQLKLAIEVARHGERAPSNIFDLVEGDNFESTEKDLTQKGAQTHFELGQQIRELDWFKRAKRRGYRPQDVYVLSTFKQRAFDSAHAQMLGLFGEDLTWPLPEDLFF